jgi:pseudouridine synthase
MVDGEPAHLGQKIDPETARVEIDGIPLPVRPDLEYILLNKPPGVISTAADTHGRTTVLDLVDAATRLYPVGRLDADSEGLILLCNDGELTERLTHPRFEVPKTYLAMVEGAPGRAELRRLTDGVELDDGPAAARSARIVDATDTQTLVEVVMTEGRNREIRRMFDAIDHPVVRLVRTAIGGLTDQRLKPGEWRPLATHEIRILYGAPR